MTQEESFVYTACPGWGDHDYCALKTIVQDGRIVRTERVVYSDPEEIDGHICQKGCLAGRMPYDKKRLTHPLKRVGERGEGKWEQISWDQALDEIAAKLLDITERHGRESVVFWSLAAGVPPSFGLGTVIATRFINLFGATFPMASIGLDNGPFYMEFYNYNTVFYRVMADPRIMIGTDLVIVWGCNPIENQIRAAQNLVRAREAGAKIIDIGLIFDGTAGFADEFYGVRPGSDGHLAMAMMDYILSNGLQDDDYLRSYTVAAYLVRSDTGLFARDAQGNYLVYEQQSGSILGVAPNAGEYPAGSIALFGEYRYDGVEVKTVLQLLKERAALYAPEAVSEQTGLTCGQIARLSKLWAETDNAFIITGYGMRYTNANEVYRMLNLLGELTGRMGKPKNGVIEGLQFQSYPIVLNDGPITFPDGVENVKSVGIRMPDWFEAAQRKDSPYKALFTPNGNPVHQQPDRQRWLDVIDGMELVVDFDVWMTDTGELADYVLPDAMPFEREDLIASACYNHLVLQEPAIEPQGDVRDAVFLWSELAKRVGLGAYFDKSVAEWLDIRLDTDYPPIATLEPKVTYERLKKEKMIRVNVPDEPKYNPFIDKNMETPTGRAEIYVERLLDFDLALPKPLKPLKIDASKEYPYQLFTGRQRFFMQSSFTDDPVAIKLSGQTPSTRINPADARSLGLTADDKVEVYNERGHVVTRLEIDESVPAGTVHVWFGWRRHQFEEGTYAEITTQCSNKETAGPVQDKWFEDWLAAGHSINAAVELIASEIGSTDAYWDSYCNIRKYESGKVA
jgi:molybdopterin-containing oxidoreductase family molybdopterin binding subunit